MGPTIYTTRYRLNDYNHEIIVGSLLKGLRHDDDDDHADECFWFDLQSFSLDKMTGKRCYMLSAKELLILTGQLGRRWQKISLSKSRLVSFSYFVIFFIFSFHGPSLHPLNVGFSSEIFDKTTMEVLDACG